MKKQTRRMFLKTSVAVAAPLVIPSSVFGATAPNERINVGIIGCGNQSTVDIPAFLGHDDCRIVAVCDVNRASYGYRNDKQFLGREPQCELVNKHYGAQTTSGISKSCTAYSDHRDVIGRDDIDAVAVIVPDHWHGLMVVAAAEAGKDIYCEKPMSLTIGQGQKMVDVVRKNNIVFQTGSHWRSSPDCRRACELVLNGRIGKVKKVITQVAEINATEPGIGWKPMPVPEGFDYERWLGPAPVAPYHAGRCFYRFRFNLDYSGGQVTNFGAHVLDITQVALGTTASGPVVVEDNGSEWPEEGCLYNTATKTAFRAIYQCGAEVTCTTSKTGFGVRFEGTEGWIDFGYKGMTTGPESLATTVLGPDDIHLPRSVPGRTENVSKQFIPDHVRNFLDCIRSRKDPINPVEDGHRTATVCHIGNIAMQLGKKLQWDAKAQQFIGDDQANAMLDRPMRAPWQI